METIKNVIAYLFVLLGFVWGTFGLIMALKYYKDAEIMDYAAMYFLTLWATLANVIMALIVSRKRQ